MCPKCDTKYEDWCRPSINLGMDDFDDEYMMKATTATCPTCDHRVQLDTLIVGPDGSFSVGG